MTDNILKYVGARIRDLRKERGLSQEQLGERAGFHFSYIGGIERAEKNISLINLSKIAEGLSVEVHELFSYSQSFNNKLNEKQEDIKEILDILLRHDTKEVKKIKSIIKEVVKN
jgi:transcriptional regulator with XRE-family HTH domain